MVSREEREAVVAHGSSSVTRVHTFASKMTHEHVCPFGNFRSRPVALPQIPSMGAKRVSSALRMVQRRSSRKTCSEICKVFQKPSGELCNRLSQNDRVPCEVLMLLWIRLRF